MQKSKHYSNTLFSADIVREAKSHFEKLSEDEIPLRRFEIQYRSNDSEDVEEWSYDTEEEFFADYRKEFVKANIQCSNLKGYAFSLLCLQRTSYIPIPVTVSTVSVTAPTRAEIEGVFQIFEKHKDESKIPVVEPEIVTIEPEPPVVFIGHGGSSQWRDLKDHLHEKHHYRVQSYEIGARAGHTIRDILEDMLSRSSFAVLVMTGEDSDSKGTIRARPNVVHEAGLFQGRLGFSRAIILLENGTEEFSNIYGVQQIRYAKGNIRETYGDVLATLNREFGTTK